MLALSPILPTPAAGGAPAGAATPTASAVDPFAALLAMLDGAMADDRGGENGGGLFDDPIDGDDAASATSEAPAVAAGPALPFIMAAIDLQPPTGDDTATPPSPALPTAAALPTTTTASATPGPAPMLDGAFPPTAAAQADPANLTIPTPQASAQIDGAVASPSPPVAPSPMLAASSAGPSPAIVSSPLVVPQDPEATLPPSDDTESASIAPAPKGVPSAPPAAPTMDAAHAAAPVVVEPKSQAAQPATAAEARPAQAVAQPDLDSASPPAPQVKTDAQAQQQAAPAIPLAPPPAEAAAPLIPAPPAKPSARAEPAAAPGADASDDDADADGSGQKPASPAAARVVTSASPAPAASTGAAPASKDETGIETTPDDTPSSDRPPPDAAQAARAHAAATPPTAPAPVRGSPETVAQLAAQILHKLEGQVSRFDIELTPAGLGKVEVRLEIAAHGQVAAAMSFDNPQAAADMRARAGELQRALEQAGFNLSGGLSFDVADGRGQPGQQNDPQASGSNAAYRGRAFQAALDAIDAPPSPSPVLRRWSQTGLDIRI